MRIRLGFVALCVLSGCAQNDPPPQTTIVPPPVAAAEKRVAEAPLPPVPPIPPKTIMLGTKAPASSHCQGRGAFACQAVHGCAWTRGYTTGAGTAVSGYCHVSTAKAPTPAAPKAATRTGSRCHRVSGYTRKSGTRVAGYTRCRN